VIVLGIDPGTAALGWGLIEQTAGRLRAIDHGCLVTSPDLPLGERLLAIHRHVAELIELHDPAIVAVEAGVLLAQRPDGDRSGHARGVVLLAAARPAGPFARRPRTRSRARSRATARRQATGPADGPDRPRDERAADPDDAATPSRSPSASRTGSARPDGRRGRPAPSSTAPRSIRSSAVDAVRAGVRDALAARRRSGRRDRVVYQPSGTRRHASTIGPHPGPLFAFGS